MRDFLQTPSPAQYIHIEQRDPDACRSTVKELVIFPRRKAGQAKRSNQAPIKLTKEMLAGMMCLQLKSAAEQLGISRTALKNACRNLGLPRWPFRTTKSGADDTECAAQSSLPSTLIYTSPIEKRDPTTSCDNKSKVQEKSKIQKLAHAHSALNVMYGTVSAGCHQPTVQPNFDHLLCTSSRPHLEDLPVWEGTAAHMIKKDFGSKLFESPQKNAGFFFDTAASTAPAAHLCSGTQDEAELFNAGCNHFADDMFGASSALVTVDEHCLW